MASKDEAPTTGAIHPASRPAAAISARETDAGVSNPDQPPMDPGARLPKESGVAEDHPEVIDTKKGDPEEGPGDKPVSVVRQNATTWWCPRCDNSQTHDFDHCAKCGLAKPKALKG